MGLCHSLRPLLFGDPEPPVEGARSDLNPMPDLDLAPVLTPAQERRRRTDRQRAEEREARRVSRSIDRRLREQRRDLRRTHRLLLLGGCWSLGWGRTGGAENWARRAGRKRRKGGAGNRALGGAHAVKDARGPGGFGLGSRATLTR